MLAVTSFNSTKMFVVGDKVASFDSSSVLRSTRTYSYSEARQVGTYSLVGPDRKYQEGDGQRKFLHLPATRYGLALDLNRGYSSGIRTKSTDHVHMEEFLRWISTNAEKVRGANYGPPAAAATLNQG